ncbi:homeobox protein Mohawk-like [Tubulanus polymorphus]|uniref:homeobox protein Mohawk-like n=1 Tax=Tubulanus polymorphus TaxID=672921 RepID=UPI003DA2B912
MDCTKCSKTQTAPITHPVSTTVKRNICEETENIQNCVKIATTALIHDSNGNIKNSKHLDDITGSCLEKVETALAMAIDFSLNNNNNNSDNEENPKGRNLSNDLSMDNGSRELSPDHHPYGGGETRSRRELSPPRLTPVYRDSDSPVSHRSSCCDEHEAKTSTRTFSRHQNRSRNTSTSDSTRRSSRKPKRNPFLPNKSHLKRTTMQSMTRPLKHWLFKNRHNPYPTKTEKLRLANGSNMTMTQVSNWFANARRRLKHTVKHSGLSWETRIKLYNNFIEGNAERLSEISDDSVFSDLDDDMQTGMTPLPIVPETKLIIPSVSEVPGDQILENVDNNDHSLYTMDTHTSPRSFSPWSIQQDAPVKDKMSESPPNKVVKDYMTCHKYKQTILQRYLNDAVAHSVMQTSSPSVDVVRRRNNSSSMCSHDSDDTFDSPMVIDEDIHLKTEPFNHTVVIGDKQQNELHWKEISAALALTSLAKARDGVNFI